MVMEQIFLYTDSWREWLEKACEPLLGKPAKSDPGAFLTSTLLLLTLFLHKPLINCSLVCCMNCSSPMGTEQLIPNDTSASILLQSTIFCTILPYPLVC